MSPSALRGLDLYFDNSVNHKIECSHCHGPNSWLFSFSQKTEGRIPEIGFFNTGLYDIDGKGSYPPGNRGKYEITGQRLDMGAFKAPTLRNIAVTAPYMHDGSVATLEEVVELYDRGGEQNPWLDPKMVKLSLTDAEKKDLLAFLRSLEGDWQPMAAPKLPE
jgi:cytochrome c peroxidase